MKPGYSISYKQKRDEITALYPCFKQYFENLEALVLQDPYASSMETILFAGKPRHVRKRYIKTTFFSGLLPDTYKYLTITYGITIDEQVIFMIANLHDFID
jgi:hypothetical protein